jgi:hypothetical protein
VSYPELIAELREGAEWFVVGTMSGAEELVAGLPRWHAIME